MQANTQADADPNMHSLTTELISELKQKNNALRVLEHRTLTGFRYRVGELMVKVFYPRFNWRHLLALPDQLIRVFQQWQLYTRLENEVMPTLNVAKFKADLSFDECRVKAMLLLQQYGMEHFQQWINTALMVNPQHADCINRVAFDLIRNIYPYQALTYGLAAYQSTPDLPLADDLVRIYRKTGNLSGILQCLVDFPQLNEVIDVEQVKQNQQLLRQGFQSKLTRQSTTANKHKVFYLLHNSLPYRNGGYAIRTQGLLTALSNHGWEISGVTRLGYPQDKESVKRSQVQPMQTIGLVPYLRLPTRQHGFGQVPIKDYLHHYEKALFDTVVEQKPAILHAASNYMNGVVANSVAKAVGIHSVYEVRGLWELTHASRDPDWAKSEMYQQYQRMETQAAIEADRVITITQALKQTLIDRGVAADKITVIPNAVDSSAFKPMPPNDAIMRRYRLDGKVVLGFFGTMTSYEGLGDLLFALAQLKLLINTPFHCLFVGDGPEMRTLRHLTKELGMYQNVTFAGRVPHEKIQKYYSVVDIFPFTRKAIPVCEKVSPLKPFEAMAMAKTLVVSSVAALAEIVSHHETGLVYQKGEITDLVEQLRRVIDDAALRQRLGNNARAWVCEQRDWQQVAAGVDAIYTELLERA